MLKSSENFNLKSYVLLIFILLVGCNKLFYYPDSRLYYPPEEHGLKSPEEIVITSSNRISLGAWFFKSEARPKGTIIQFHGNAQNMSSHYANLYWLTQNGFNLFTFDYSGYGVSESRPSPLQTVEDGVAALILAHEMHLKNGGGMFVIYAESLGGVVALRSLESFDKKIDLLVLDSSFYSYKNMAYKAAKKNWLTWVFGPLTKILTSDEMAPQLFMKQNLAPTLVIHSQYDEVVPYSEGVDMFQKIIGQKEMWTLEMKGHVATFQSRANRDRFLKYLNQL